MVNTVTFRLETPNNIFKIVFILRPFFVPLSAYHYFLFIFCSPILRPSYVT